MKILLATDGSKCSQKAAEEFCRLIGANREGAEAAEIKIISVFESPAASIAMEPFAASAEHYQSLEETAQKQAEGFAEKAATSIRERLPEDSGVNVTNQIEMGQPARSIVEEAEKWQADLIVLGSHGRGFWGRVLLGSVSDSVVHHAPCSVLVVRSKENAKGE
jgi:nucleotide-binding universal stress UspA family protein